MKKAKDLKLKMVVCLTVLIMMVFPASAILAQDADLDGFSDAQELNGITLLDGNLFPGKNSINPNTNQPYARADRLDPDSRDFFVILLLGNNPLNPTYNPNISLIPTNPLEFVSNPQTAGGLGVATHVITPSSQYPYANRTVTSSSPSQKAVRVTESLDSTSSDTLGVTTGQGMSMDESTVYTVRITNFIKNLCGNAFGTTNCRASTGEIGQVLIDKYVKHTIAHEIGHSLSLTGRSVKSYGGYHYNATDNVEMSQSVYYTKDSQGVVIFYIGTGFKSTDQSGFKLQ
jgi:hypothetical protein